MRRHQTPNQRIHALRRLRGEVEARYVEHRQRAIAAFRLGF